MYGNSYPPRRGNDPLSALRAAGIPVTIALIAANVITFLFKFFLMSAPGSNPFRWFVFSSETWPMLPWTVVTWPFVASLDLIGLLFGCLWAYMVGGSLERSWGTKSFGIFLAATSMLTAVTLYLGGLLLRLPVHAEGIWLATAAPTIAWCALNRRETIRLNMVLPVPAPVLGWLTVAYTWYRISVSVGNPFLGIFALSGCAAAYWYATEGRYASRGYKETATARMARGRSASAQSGRGGNFAREGGTGTGRTGSGFNLLRWWKDRQERRRLEAIFRRSGFTDDERR